MMIGSTIRLLREEMNASPYIVCASQHDRKKNIFLVEDEKTAVSFSNQRAQHYSILLHNAALCSAKFVNQNKNTLLFFCF